MYRRPSQDRFASSIALVNCSSFLNTTRKSFSGKESRTTVITTPRKSRAQRSEVAAYQGKNGSNIAQASSSKFPNRAASYTSEKLLWTSTASAPSNPTARRNTRDRISSCSFARRRNPFSAIDRHDITPIRRTFHDLTSSSADNTFSDRLPKNLEVISSIIESAPI